MVREEAPHRAGGDRGGSLDGKAVDAGADRRKRDRVDAVLLGEAEAAFVAASQYLVLVVSAALPDWADRVNHPAGRQVMTAGQDGFARIAVPDRLALLPQAGARGTVDGTAHTASR